MLKTPGTMESPKRALIFIHGSGGSSNTWKYQLNALNLNMNLIALDLPSHANSDPFEELSLDYDVTVMPPTKYLLPAKETLFQFKVGEESSVEPVIEAPPTAIIGVHPYDIKAIELLDEAFTADNPDFFQSILAH